MNTVEALRATRKGDWFQTYTGVAFFPYDPRPEDVRIEDIAHHLSMICRWGGAVQKAYSVAEHSVRVAAAVEVAGGTPEEVFWGLMHDAAEAYLGDVISPLKRGREDEPSLRKMHKRNEARVMACIVERFGLTPTTEPAIVKEADLLLLATEYRDLMGPCELPRKVEYVATALATIHPMTQEQAETAFLKRCMERYR